MCSQRCYFMSFCHKQLLAPGNSAGSGQHMLQPPPEATST